LEGRADGCGLLESAGGAVRAFCMLSWCIVLPAFAGFWRKCARKFRRSVGSNDDMTFARA
jgi:hypothetical protein